MEHLSSTDLLTLPSDVRLFWKPWPGQTLQLMLKKKKVLEIRPWLLVLTCWRLLVDDESIFSY